MMFVNIILVFYLQVKQKLI